MQKHTYTATQENRLPKDPDMHPVQHTHTHTLTHTLSHPVL